MCFEKRKKKHSGSSNIFCRDFTLSNSSILAVIHDVSAVIHDVFTCLSILKVCLYEENYINVTLVKKNTLLEELPYPDRILGKIYVKN